LAPRRSVSASCRRSCQKWHSARRAARPSWTAELHEEPAGPRRCPEERGRPPRHRRRLRQRRVDESNERELSWSSPASGPLGVFDQDREGVGDPRRRRRRPSPVWSPWSNSPARSRYLIDGLHIVEALDGVTDLTPPRGAPPPWLAPRTP